MVEAKIDETAETGEVQRPVAGGMFSALQHRNFRLLITGLFSSSTGMQIRMVAQGWLVYDLTSSPFLLGLVSTTASLPMLLFTPLIGVIIDRADRKKLLVGTQSISMIALLVLATLVLTKQVEVWHVFAFALVYGTMLATYAPARQAFVPDLVHPDNLMNAIALSSAANQLTRVIGPSIAGGLLVFVGIAGCFYFASLTYVGIIVAVLLINAKSMPAGDTSATIWENLKEGLAYVVGNKTMFALIAMESIPAMFGWQYQMLMPIFARDVLDVGPSGLGLLMSAAGAGALVGALALAALGDFRRKGFLLVGSAVGFGIALILFALSPWFGVSLVTLVLVGGASTVYAALTSTLIQLLVPNELRGRITSFYMLAFNGMMPLGSLQSGSLAGYFGAPTALAIGGAIVVVFSLAVMFFVPRLRQL